MCSLFFVISADFVVLYIFEAQLPLYQFPRMRGLHKCVGGAIEL